MGDINDLIGMIPGLGNKVKLGDAKIDPKAIERTKAIIFSMTIKERRDPSILNSSRKQRIAAGSGTSVQEINRLLKQFEQSKMMMKQFRNKKNFRI
jgi:signal recognition particle subunit SRP54